ncbi:MAG TPA: adenylyltransferase [Anaerolineaceae bacterium]|nr:adenylyltransferase [Anaerolineaceae bacterium]
MKSSGLHSEALERYSRQINLPEIGEHGQRLLKKAAVLIVGLGGLGSSAAFYLAAAGVGRLGLMDHDMVQPTNLNRQILYSVEVLGQPKAIAAKDSIKAFNPHIVLETYTHPFSTENGPEICDNYDLVIDATDNFNSKYLINDLCAALKKPDIYGTASGFEGRITVLSFKQGPCLRCLFPEPAKSSQESNPVLGTVTGVIGSLQANEAVKIILGIGDVLNDRLVTFNAKTTTFTEYTIAKNQNCPICK